MDTFSPLAIFFFYCDADLSDLHSFPTRRSSDLGSRRVPPLAHLRRSGGVRADWRPGPGRRADRTGPDRKSTRLNSSHRCISYAVFCLKKKIRPLRWMKKKLFL